MNHELGLKLNLDEFLLKTATIDERLSALFNETSSQKINTLEAAEKLAQWCNASASGDWKKFAAWLSYRKTSFDKALSRLSILHKNPELDYPEWVIDSEWIIQALTSKSLSKSVVNRQDCKFLCPFSDLFNEVVEASLAAQTKKTQSIDLKIFSQEALDDLTRSLLKELTDLSAKVIYQLFTEQKVMPDESTQENDTLYYLKFITWMRVTGWSEVLKRWPVLIRLLAVATRQWINNSSQIIHRLSETANQAKNLIYKTPLESNLITAIDIDVSDTHNNGQSVAIITFDNGIKLVYKPKDLKIDFEFHKFLKYISTLGSPIHLDIPKVFIATDYGYTEFITYKSCLRDEEVKHFFTLMGGWLAIFYIFIATDMHEENFIAHGKIPYPIDLEMLLHPLIRDEDITLATQDASKEAQNILMSSVMMIGMLPSFSYGPNGEPLYSYGLKPETDPMIVEGWANINTKNMRRAKFKKNGKSYFNVPELKDAPVDLKKYLPNITNGFISLAKFLLENRSVIINSASLNALDQVTSRRALRRTHFYFMLGHRLKDPQFLSNGVLWSAQADFLARPFKLDGSNEFGTTLIFSEINALLNLNIPYFTISTNGLSLHDEVGFSENAGKKSGFEQAKERFNNLTFDEIAWQSHLIEMSTYSIASKEQTTLKPRPAFAANSKILSDQELEGEVKSIYDKIKQSAIEINGSCTWLGFQWIDAHNRVGQLAPLGLNLYEGNAGMALFLAAYANVFADQDSKNDAMAVLQPFLKAMDEQDFNAGIRQIGLGGATGVGGQIYTLTTLAELMENDQLLERGVILADLITTDMIHSDRKFDVIGGGSGAILGLMKLYRATNEKRILAKAEEIAQYLLESRRSIEGFTLWPFDETARALTGFSHGTAGYAHTFSLLAKATNNPKYQNAAEECLAYEESVFSQDEGNWPDKRNTSNTQNPSKKLLFLCQWCHGSGGIGLSRIAMKQYGVQRGTSTNLDISRAIQSVKKNWPHDLDHLCCGNTGNAELLLESGLKLGNSDDLFESRKMLSQVIIQAREGDGYRFAHASPIQYNVSLFTGIAGIGYSILRQLNPNKIPNILIWE